MEKALQQSITNKFKSPAAKLIRFFENSRDKWKNKAKGAKYNIKLLKKKIKSLKMKRSLNWNQPFRQCKKRLSI